MDRRRFVAASGAALTVLARSELALIVRLLRVGSYTGQTGRRLYALAAEASRQAAWDYFDQDNHPAARRYFETALRASATAGDPVTGAYALSFAAVQCSTRPGSRRTPSRCWRRPATPSPGRARPR